MQTIEISSKPKPKPHHVPDDGATVILLAMVLILVVAFAKFTTLLAE